MAVALAACSDSSSEIASPGSQGPNPGVPGGGDNGGGDGDNGGSAGNCPTGTTRQQVGDETHCAINAGAILSDLTLTKDNIYVLNGPGNIFIGEPTDANGNGGTRVTLKIEAGTRIYSDDPETALVITRGSRIDAQGTANAPIIFTSARDMGIGGSPFTGNASDDPNTGEWGGLVLNGLAPINACAGTQAVCEKEGEGDSGLFGGNNPADSSGILRYVQIKYSGALINSEDELNGIAFQGVGSGTTVEYIQVHNGADDGIEFFGGTATVKHLIVSGANDDYIDWTDGWQGKIQHAIVMQNPNLPEGDRGIEADNLDDDHDASPRSNPTLANLTFVGAASSDPAKSVGSQGILLRVGTSAKIYNSVVTNFADGCLDLDDAATFAQAQNGALVVQSTLLSCSQPTEEESGDPIDLSDWFLAQSNNVIGDASLSGYVNGSAEAAVVATDMSKVDSFFDKVDYIGAVNGADAPANWTLGWTFGLNAAAGCPSVNGITEDSNGNCVLTGTITDDVRLSAGRDYLLNGVVRIGTDAGMDPASPLAGSDPATLTIDAGVRVLAQTAESALFISRGSRIVANGTKDAPIIMSAVGDDTHQLDTDTALWGGLVINGRAPINACAGAQPVCEKEGEGDSGLFGGNVPNDDSGVLRYVVVKYAGRLINAEDELNGIAFQGVGNGTTVDYIQSHNGADDAVEFFGGTVNVKHLVLTGAGDDSLDWTDGWQGKIQYALIVQNPNQPEAERGIEADNLEGDFDAAPRSHPKIANITFVGAGDKGIGERAMVLRRGTAVNLMNVVAANWSNSCFDLDDAATFAVAGPNATTRTGDLTLQSSLLSCSPAVEVEAGDPYDTKAWVEAQSNNVLGVAATLASPATGGKKYINGSAEAAVTATDPSTVDPFFDSVNFIGAVKDAGSDWTAGWTVWLNR